jgi:hypothetical protein
MRPLSAERPIATAGADGERGRARFDPFRELDRLAEHTVSIGTRAMRSTGDELADQAAPLIGPES